ncbi:MAG: hypothetical protein K6E12_07805 [Saccharofermentans sp.]|nr:hypothetical protein [Saccharofermentans sp.]
MTIVKSHLCNSCGGLLNIDIDRQLYICPFCGVTYDYEYFREDNVVDIATRALTRSEFGSAKEAYDFIIKKDPHSFEALRGLFLCACKWKSLSPIINYKKIHITDNHPVLVKALASCLPEHKEYFGSIQKALGILKEYRQNEQDIHRLEGDKETAEKRLNGIHIARENNKKQFVNKIVNIFDKAKEDPTEPLKIYFSLLGVFGLILLIWAFGWWMFAVAVAAFVIAIVLYNVRKSLINKMLEKEIIPLQEKLNKINTELDVKRINSTDLMNQYDELAKKLIILDHRLHRAPGNNSEDEDEEDD